MQNIAREGDIGSISSLVELVAAAAAICPEKATFVSRIMEMSPDGQVEMKVVLQTGLKRISDYEADYDEGDENELVFGHDDYADDGKNDDRSVYSFGIYWLFCKINRRHFDDTCNLFGTLFNRKIY